MFLYREQSQMCQLQNNLFLSFSPFAPFPYRFQTTEKINLNTKRFDKKQPPPPQEEHAMLLVHARMCQVGTSNARARTSTRTSKINILSNTCCCCWLVDLSVGPVSDKIASRHNLGWLSTVERGRDDRIRIKIIFWSSWGQMLNPEVNWEPRQPGFWRAKKGREIQKKWLLGGSFSVYMFLFSGGFLFLCTCFGDNARLCTC